MKYESTLQQLAYLIIVLFGVGLLLFWGKSLVIPMIFGLFLAILLSPVAKRIEKIVKFSWLAILLSFLVLITPFTMITAMISVQLVEIVDSLPSIGDNLTRGVNNFLVKIQEIFPLLASTLKQMDASQMAPIVTSNIGLLKDGLVKGSGLIFLIGMAFIYAFFFLLYKDSYRQFIVRQYDKKYRPEVKETLNSIKKMVQKYVVGLGLVMIILCVVNSTGLAIIGVDYPIFWGCLAGLLAVIPYIGSFIGGALPFFYSLATADYTLQPVVIILFYLAVQQIEGNLITPKVVGNQVNINPLVSIIALLFFGLFWGLSGIILALPIVSIAKIIFEQFDETADIALLMSTEFSHLNDENLEIDGVDMENAEN